MLKHVWLKYPEICMELMKDGKDSQVLFKMILGGM